jgi:Fe2+ or Zn2+ uptake regulation protein
MYFRESDTIASDNPELRPAVVRVDELLYKSGNRSVAVADLTMRAKLDPAIVGRALERFEAYGVIERVDLRLCANCNRPIEDVDSTTLACDVCGEELGADKEITEPGVRVIASPLRANGTRLATSRASEPAGTVAAPTRQRKKWSRSKKIRAIVLGILGFLALLFSVLNSGWDFVERITHKEKAPAISPAPQSPIDHEPD